MFPLGLIFRLMLGGFSPGVSSGGGGYSTIQDEGTPLTQRTTVNMTGAGVSCSDSGGITVCTISGGGSGGTSPLILSFGGF